MRQRRQGDRGTRLSRPVGEVNVREARRLNHLVAEAVRVKLPFNQPGSIDDWNGHIALWIDEGR